MAVYITVSTEDKLNIVITSNLIAVMDIIVNAFQQAAGGIPIIPAPMRKLNLQNHIGHESRLELIVSEEVGIFFLFSQVFIAFLFILILSL